MATIIAKHPDGVEMFDAENKGAVYRKFWAWVDEFADSYPEMARPNWKKTQSINDYDWWKWNK